MKIRASYYFLLCSFIFLLLSCNNSSQTYNQDEQTQTTPAPKTVFYYDEDQDAFLGTAKWTAKTTFDKALLGYEGDQWGLDCIDDIYWIVDSAPDSSAAPSTHIWQSNYSNSARVTYSIDTTTCTLTANFKLTNQDSTAFSRLKSMGDLPGVEISVKITFLTGQSTIIATQTEFDYDKSTFEDYYKQYMASENFISPRLFIENWDKVNSIDPSTELKGIWCAGGHYACKIKKITLYICSDFGCTDIERTFVVEPPASLQGKAWVASFSPALYSSDVFNSYPKFKYIVEFVNGEKFDSYTMEMVKQTPEGSSVQAGTYYTEQTAENDFGTELVIKDDYEYFIKKQIDNYNYSFWHGFVSCEPNDNAIVLQNDKYIESLDTDISYGYAYYDYDSQVAPWDDCEFELKGSYTKYTINLTQKISSTGDTIAINIPFRMYY